MYKKKNIYIHFNTLLIVYVLAFKTKVLTREDDRENFYVYEIDINRDFDFKNLVDNDGNKFSVVLHMGRVMRKQTFCICENKGADQLCSY